MLNIMVIMAAMQTAAVQNLRQRHDTQEMPKLSQHCYPICSGGQKEAVATYEQQTGQDAAC